MNPVNTIKSNITVSKAIAWTVTGLLVLAVADAAGITPFVLQPYTTLKKKLAKKN